MVIEFEFEFEEIDWLEFQIHYFENSSQFKQSKNMLLAIVPITLLLISFLEYLRGEFKPSILILFGIISLFWFFICPRFLKKSTSARLKKMISDGDNSGILGLNKYTLNKDGIIYSQPESEHTYKWKGIKKLDESDSHYFLYDSAISALIIPKKKINVDISELDEILKKNLSI